jgi:hypothetical protein
MMRPLPKMMSEELELQVEPYAIKNNQKVLIQWYMCPLFE